MNACISALHGEKQNIVLLNLNINILGLTLRAYDLKVHHAVAAAVVRPLILNLLTLTGPEAAKKALDALEGEEEEVI